MLSPVLEAKASTVLRRTESGVQGDLDGLPLPRRCAAVMPMGLALLRFTYPRRLLGQAIAWNALAIAGASAAGPAVGAGLLSVASWPWLFAVNLPIGALVLVACAGLPRPPSARRSLDVGSITLNAIMFAAFVLGSDRLPSSPWSGGALLVVSAASLVLLV